MTVETPAAESSKQAFSLQNILGDDHEHLEHPEVQNGQENALAVGWDEEETSRPVAEGFCVECEGALSNCWLLEQSLSCDESDQPAEVLCETCEDQFCEVCFSGARLRLVGSTRLFS